MAATILVVGFLGMIQAITIGTQMMDTAQKQTLATQIAQAEIDRLRYSAWTSISTLPTSAPFPTITIDSSGTAQGTAPDLAWFGLTNNATLRSAAKGYTCKLSATDNQGINAGLRRITCTVTWSSPLGQSLTRSLTGYFSDGGYKFAY